MATDKQGKKPTKVTSSASRAGRSKTSSTKAQLKTTSSGKTAGKNPKVDNRAQRQSVSTAKVTTQKPRTPEAKSTAKVTSSASRDAGPTKADAQRWQKVNQSAKTSGTGWKGAPGTADAPKNALGDGSRNPRSQIAANKMTRTLKAAQAARKAASTVANVGKVARAGGVAAAAAAGLQARNTADGTLTAAKKRGDVRPRKIDIDEAKAKAANAKRKGASFDDAFRDARRAGVKTFTWRGKKYTTEMK